MQNFIGSEPIISEHWSFSITHVPMRSLQVLQFESKCLLKQRPFLTTWLSSIRGDEKGTSIFSIRSFFSLDSSADAAKFDGSTKTYKIWVFWFHPNISIFGSVSVGQYCMSSSAPILTILLSAPVSFFWIGHQSFAYLLQVDWC